MTDCDKLMEQKDLPKVVYRKRHAKREKARGKKQNRVVKAFFSKLVRRFADAYPCLFSHRVRASPTLSAAIKLLFPTTISRTRTRASAQS